MQRMIYLLALVKFIRTTNYISRWNQAEEELASLFHLTLSRPVPSVMTVGGVIDVTSIFGIPHGYTWKGVYADAALRAVSPITSHESRITDSERQKTFMQLSALQGSVLEHRLFEDDFKVDSISTAKLMQLCLSNSELCTQNSVLILDKTNINAVLPSLNLDDNIREDIENAVNQGLSVRIPQSLSSSLPALSYKDWTGIGYIKENPETGEAGYMLSGMIAGGMTAEEWADEYLKSKLSGTEIQTNKDPLAAAKIIKIPVTDWQRGTVGLPLAEQLAVLVTDKDYRPVSDATVTFSIKAGKGNFGASILSLWQPNEEVDVKTAKNGIAKVTLFLGKKTEDNPDYMKLDPADEFATQIGLNLVTASVKAQSGAVVLNAPFAAMGKPDKPEKLVKVLGDKNRAMANNPGGTLIAKVVDKYENPISNLTITYKTTETKSFYSDVPLPQKYRTVEFYSAGECPLAYPLYGECPTKPELSVQSKYTGAAASIILGNTVGTEYAVKAEVPGTTITAVTFTLYTEGYRNRNDYIPTGIYIKHLRPVNATGDPISASRAGSELKAPLITEFFMLHDDYTMEGPHPCTGDATQNCYDLIPSGTVNITPIANGTVDYSPIKGGGQVTSTTNLGSGKYQATYKTGPDPMENLVGAFGMATVKVPEVLFSPMATNLLIPSFSGIADMQYYRPAKKLVLTEYPESNLKCSEGTCGLRTRDIIGLKSGQHVYFYPAAPENELHITDSVQKTVFELFGVLPVITGTEPTAMSIDEAGQLIYDTAIKFRIDPLLYNADIADIDIYERQPESANDVWMYLLSAAQTSGEGGITLSRGFNFDVKKEYYAQVVLNRGGDMEIRSDTYKLPTAGIWILDDKQNNITEARFGDGSKEEKRYHIDLISKAMVDVCTTLTGTIRVKNAKGETIKTPEQSYYQSSYSLSFEPSDGKCLVRINDGSGTLKGKFIVTNLSKEALDARRIDYTPAVDLSNVVPIYGGLGNTLQVEINGATKEIRVEPVGVIVIAIDGLRQDVLYPNELDRVQDGGRYRVDIGQLQGIKQILAGYDLPEAKQRYVMLPEVTAIFPSITFASWASIFTGKQPNETGITGNEFFARDVYGNGTSPVITWMAEYGYQPGYVKFDIENPSYVLNHSMPLELLPIMKLQDKLDASSSGQLLQTDLFWKDIKDLVKTRYQLSPESDRCDLSKYECATTAMFNQYAKGADWWGTPSLTWKNLYDLVDSHSLTKMMDMAASNETVNFINNYFSFTNPADKRKRFPALFSVYFSALDHFAHMKGMTDYSAFFRDTTDPQIKDVINALKVHDEFDNKIFVIVADHGHTAMPTDFPQMPDEEGILHEADTSCEMKVKDFDKDEVKYPELANNNLHIWELGDYLRIVGEFVEQATTSIMENKILAPKEIAKMFTNPATGQPLGNGAAEKEENANIIAAFNGPMAHVYIKGSDWSATLSMEKVIEAAEIFRVTLQGARGGDSPFPIFPTGMAERFGYKIGRLSNSVDEILIRDSGVYRVFTVENASVSLKDLTGLSAEYVDAVNRIEKMNNANRSGDIVLIMKDDTSGNTPDRYTTGVACKSWHGSLNKSDSYVPFIFAYPGGNKTEIETMIKKETACSSDYGHCKGNWKLTDTIKEIITGQYR